MICKLEKEVGADATKKAYCNKELKESNIGQQVMVEPYGNYKKWQPGLIIDRKSSEVK